MPKTQHPGMILLATFLALLGALALAPLIGSQELHFGKVMAYLSGTTTPDGVIFFKVRLPRVLLGVLAGAGLAVAGVVFQVLLRNPLATPYTLGVASGSAFGALLVIKTGLVFSFLGFSSIQFAAFAGSFATILLVYLLGRKAGRISVYGMILAGVTLNYLFAALILILHYLADFTETHQMIRWTIGGLDISNYAVILRSYPIVLATLIVLFLLSNALNVLSTGEEMALSKGVSVSLIQKIAFAAASLLTATVVAVSGPIGFIGLIIPHLLRMVMGTDHRYLIPASACLGGAFLVAADTIARTILSPIDLPVGIITTLLGGPFFLWVLVRQQPL